MSPLFLLLSLIACEDDKGVDTASIDTAIISVDDTGTTSDPTDSATSGDDTFDTAIIGPPDTDTDTDTGTIDTEDTAIIGPPDTEDTGGGSDTVDTEEEKEGAPEVTWLNPTGGEFLYGDVDLLVDAIDDVLVVWVEFYVDGGLIDYDIDGEPWEVVWDSDAFTEGAHTLTAIAYDDVSESGEATIDVIVDRTPPVVIIDNPVDGEDVAGVISVEASVVEVNLDYVEFYIDGVLVDTFSATDPLVYSWDARSWLTGSYPIQVIAYDLAGHSGSDEISVNVVSAPDVYITDPLDGDTVTGTVDLAATATDDGTVEELTFTLNGIDHDTLTGASPYSSTWETCGYTPGYVVIEATATDNEGLTGSDNITVEVDQPFEIDLLAPLAGDVEPDEELLNTLFDDRDIASVVWDVDGVTIASTSTAGALPGSVTCTYECGCEYYDETGSMVGLTDGSHTLTVTATNTAGETASDSVIITVDSDEDDDGHPGEEWGGDDCDDSDADINPDAAEVCDGIDNDCDGVVDEDPTDGDTWYADDDGDGFGDAGDSVVACDEPAGYEDNDDDCDDTDASVNPDAEEICSNGIDDDCDGVIDEADGAGGGTWYADDDGDGFGDPGDSVEACEEPPGYTDNDDDCDDTDGGINPDADEICDGADNDCDGVVDEDDAIDADTWYADDDSDGFGDPGDSVQACDEPPGYTDNDGDCDDTDGSINPDADEICDGVDNDCDGLIDDDDPSLDLGTADTWYVDADGDGYGDPGAGTVTACDGPPGYEGNDDDCDDTDGSINPDALEICDGIDNDCTALTVEDGVATLDGDGAYTSIQTALNDASDGSVITICDGTYLEALSVSDAVTLESLNGSSAVTIDANGGGAVIRVNSGAFAEIRGLTLTGGTGTYESSVGGRIGGGVQAYYADGIEIYDSVIEDNTADLGGGVFGSGYADDLIEGTVVRQNSASYGGGIAGFGFELNTVSVDNNDANYGGGLWLYADLTLMDADTVVANNYALIGGGVYLDQGDLVMDTATTIMDNEADLTVGGTGGGGGIYATNGSLTGGIVSGNFAGDYGGGVFVQGSSTAIGDMSIEDNEADYGGGGIVFYATDISVSDLSIIGNTAFIGGGVWAEQLDIELRTCTINDNTASYGGGILAYIADDVNLRSSTINDNVATIEGGGAFVLGVLSGSTWTYDSQLSSTSSNWGTGSTDNSSEDIWVDAYDNAYSYGTSASFTCVQSSGTCF